MQCPKCQFEHRDQTTECLRCGIVFAKYVSRQDVLQSLPIPIRDDPELPCTPEEARSELRCRQLALPVALLAAWLLMGFDLKHLIRIFLSMWVHESGHAVTAWLCGFGAFPGPWRTPVSSERMLTVTVALAAGLCWGTFQAWRTQRWALVAGGVTVLILQLICTFLPSGQANALIVFGGDAGCLVLGSLLMATFYVRRESAIYRGALRWGFLVIGAAAFADAFSTWWGARHDFGQIPFGEIEGVGMSDPSRLTEDYGWGVQAMVQRYVWLGAACLGALAILYAVGIVRARAGLRMRGRVDVGPAESAREIVRDEVYVPVAEPAGAAEPPTPAVPPPLPERYRLVFDGSIALTADRDEAKESIARLFRCERDRVDQLFCGRPMVLKRDLDHASAVKMKEAFDRTGAICTMEAEKATAAAPPGPP